MQPGVTVVLATVWLVVAMDVVGAATLHPFHLALDQYSPLPPYHHGVHRGVEGQLDWKDRNPTKNQPFDLPIGPGRSISVNDSPVRSFEAEHPSRDLIFPTENDAPYNEKISSLKENKQSRNHVGRKFTNEDIFRKGTKLSESFSREIPPLEFEESFVADDTFQDQGPGSVEIYKLDLFKEKALLSSTSTTKSPTKTKSKVPKKTSRINWKAKTTEYKTTSPKIHYKQSNTFDDSRTEVPTNIESFGVGGVPELQVGCEGLEASSHKLKRSIDLPGKDSRHVVDPWLDVTPISLDIDYDLSSEDGYEEMDELVKLKRLETTTKKSKQNRGDMEATLHSDFFTDKRHSEKLPVRGDLGKSSVSNVSVVSVVDNEKNEGNKEGLHHDKEKHKSARKRDDSRYEDGMIANQGRKLLWLDESTVEKYPEDQKRSKRALWGFGEDEGVVSSDELQTENQRRRQEYERRRQMEEKRREEEARRRNLVENRTNSEIEKIREEYEQMLEQTRREEEERRRKIRPEVTLTGTTSEYNAQHKDRERQELEASRRGYGHRSGNSEEEIRRQRLYNEEVRRREEERRRQQEEEEQRRMKEEELRRYNHNRLLEEMHRKRPEGNDRNELEERRREWLQNRRQQEEEERKRQEQNRNEAPNNLELYQQRSNDTRRTMEQENREREEKLRQYIQRNQPVNINRASDQRREELERRRMEEERRTTRRREEEEERRRRIEEERRTTRRREEEEERRRRIEEERRTTRRREEEEENRRRMIEQRRRLEEESKLQEYIRRNQPIHVQKTNESHDRNWLEHRRIMEERRQHERPRYPEMSGGRRNHGPSAPANIESRSYTNEAQRREQARRLEEESKRRERERQEEEERRREALRREEEFRRAQSRRYEEERKRLEAVRLDGEKRRKELAEEEARRSQAGRTRPLENSRPVYENRRRYEEHRRRQDTSLIPGNLVLNESGRALDRERQEQERRRVESERRRQEENRMKETRQYGGYSAVMKEQRRRLEEARLNALPVRARIIVRPGGSSSLSPVFRHRAGFENEIDFSGINPNRQGVEVSRFPVAPTARPPIQSPGPCVWAVVQCCPSNRNRLVTCFESMGCPGVNWDPNPCRASVAQAAREEVMKFYDAADRNHNL